MNSEEALNGDIGGAAIVVDNVTTGGRVLNFVMNHIPESLVSFLEIGGPIVWLLIAMSIILITILIAKLIQFSAAGILASKPRKRAKKVVSLWNLSARREAIQEAEKGADMLNRVLLSAVMHLDRNSLSRAALVGELERIATSTLNRLRTHLRTTELIAGLAPLLGLLGTVLGMIEAFKAMEAAGNNVDPSVLSGGIWQALLTTAIGLAVAVPAMLVHNWIERRVETFSQDVNDFCGQILTAASIRKIGSEDILPTTMSSSLDRNPDIPGWSNGEHDQTQRGSIDAAV